MKTLLVTGSLFLTGIIGLGVIGAGFTQPATAQPSGGFGPDTNVGLNVAQLDQARRALTIADQLNAPPLAVLALVCGALGESNFTAIPNHKGSGYAGVFQADPDNIPMENTELQAQSFLKGGKGFQQGGAITLATQHPDMTPGDIATRVEASGEPPKFYDDHRSQAERIIAAWNQSESAFPPINGTQPLTAGTSARIAPNGSAVAPANAPPEIKAMIAAGNAINTYPYLYGGGHPNYLTDKQLDCSSSTSYVLHGGGLFPSTSAIVSSNFAQWGDPGPGKWVTIWANDGHVFLEVASLRMDTGRYDTGPNAGEKGPRWREGNRYKKGFTVRHPRGF